MENLKLNTVEEAIEDIKEGNEQAVDELCELLKKLMK